MILHTLEQVYYERCPSVKSKENDLAVFAFSCQLKPTVPSETTNGL
jgi:hypothetical protein